MKYLFLLYADENAAPAYGSEEFQQQIQAYDDFFQDVNARGILRGGDPVQGSSTAKTVRVRNGSSQAAPGPFNTGGEQIIGYYVLECKDEAEAVESAAKIPAAKAGAVEVRPILSM